MQSPRRILLLLVSMVGAALVGWITAASMAPETRARGSRLAEDPQVESLMQQLQLQEELSEAERVLLLERLIALERLQEAEVALQPWITARSTPRELSLFKAELQRLNGQPEAARRSLNQLMLLHPNDPQVLQLLVLLDQQRGRQIQAKTELTTRFKGLEPGQRLEIGLLLADLLRQSGSHKEAVNLYRQLASEEPSNTRPLLALALLQQDQGHTNDVEALLKQARQRRDSNGQIDPLIDVLAGRLGLSAARYAASEQPGPTAMRADSGRP
ncbi:tetratricopeptide repeat protein [Synechococcus sp. MU1625]|uniref:tetratricopeptide repeat protein n=1 Tax=Synechococcus sp. MU1625 TaxID=2508347 RepID=UPI001CF90B61|nr:tetratricopeptide repeat protein [Synechococcus sp. MU1625]